MTFTFRHPKFYKELRMQYGPHKAIGDSEEKSEVRVARGPGLKHQAPSVKHQAIRAPSGKPQAPSNKLQAPSRKLQAP